jgi:hypothetical protein
MRCQTCGTPDAGAEGWDVCQHCGHAVGGRETVFDRMLGWLQHSGQTQAEKDAQAEVNLAQAIPMDMVLSTTFIVPAGGAGIVPISLGGQNSPDVGRVWEVRRIVIGGLAINTVAAGSAYVFKQGAPPTDLNTVNAVASYTTMPATQLFGTHQFFVNQSEGIWLAVVGATAAQQLVVSMQVEDWADQAWSRARFSS